MYIKTVKLKKQVFIAAALTASAAAVLAAAGIAARLTGANGRKVYKMATEQQRQALISELGWETGDSPAQHKTITIPDDFDEVYIGYNELQKEQGFDLSDYKGMKAELYTYEVYNYPDHPDCIQLTLIGIGGELIGGDVCCTELDGFMQGLLCDEKSAVTETSSQQ